MRLLTICWPLLTALAGSATASDYFSNPLRLASLPAPAAGAAVPVADLLEYKLDENTGTAITDTSAGGHNGTIRNTADWRVGLGASSTAAVTNNGTTGTGGGFIRSTAAITMSGTNKLTISFWAKVTGWSGSQMLAESSVQYFSQSFAWALYVADATHLELALDDDAGDFLLHDYTAPSTGATHHYVMELDSSTVAGASSLYVDGVPLTPTSTPQNTRIHSGNFTSQIVFFSARNSGASQSEPVQGTWDHIQMFSGLLSQAQVTALYNAGPQ